MNIVEEKRNGTRRKISVEKAVRERYAKGAQAQEPALCCAPPDYDKKYLEVIPKEIIERDYGCGDPSKYVKKGETVLDLGSGTGKICYIVSQMVGPEGRVIGVDMNDEMLALARRYQKEIGDKIGYHNVEFRRGRIQDLKLDLDKADVYLRENPIKNASDLLRYEEFVQEQKANYPLIPDNSVDLVVSNCVLNLVSDEEKKQLFAEIYRVLKKGGRVAISDIVSDEDVPEHLKNDPELWSGCISGALREDAFLNAFAQVGFYGIEIAKRDDKPWQVVEGIEFRALTVTAYKGKEGPCLERNQAVIYRGPWKAVIDDDGHTLYRGERMAVCDKTFRIYSQEPYAQDIIPVPPHEEIPLEEAKPFACTKTARRHPRETKGMEYNETHLSEGPYCDCGPDGC
ncbi:MAG: methyltransferase domain-containing protein [Calditrichaeota bacterium]|nr:MAG: methyltransferase domain-containing protein [Calditrichota bacterium]